MELCDAAWLSSTSAEAAASEALYQARLAGKGSVGGVPAAGTEKEQKKEKAKKGEKKKTEADEDTARRRLPRHTYFMRPSSHPSFFPGRVADLYVNGQKVWWHPSLSYHNYCDV
jgi:hypothetical protein